VIGLAVRRLNIACETAMLARRPAITRGLGPLAGEPARRVIPRAVLAGLAAFLVDVYLY
jgi:hypothetical protein